MTTLLVLRTKLNGELGVVTDGETAPWTSAVRNEAISDGYADLWRVGVWKSVTQTVPLVTDTYVYAMTSIRRLERIELVDSTGRLIGAPRGLVQDDGAGGYELRLTHSMASGADMLVRGWTAYTSTFANDSAEDDLPAENNRVPLLKAKAILYRQQLASFARYKTRQAAPPEMNVTADQLLSLIGASEREYQDAAKVLSDLRPRAGQVRRL